MKSTSVTLTWTASSRGCCAVTGYDVTYMQAFNDVGTVAALGNVTTATVTADIRPGQQYTFQVSAHDDLGHRSGRVQPGRRGDPGRRHRPGHRAAGGADGSEADPTNGPSTTLTWSPSTDNVAVTGYNVYRFDGVFISTLLSTVTGTTYTATVVSPRDQFYVRARDAAGNRLDRLEHGHRDRRDRRPRQPVGQRSSSSPPPGCRAARRSPTLRCGPPASSPTSRSPTPAPRRSPDWVVTFRFGGDQRIGQSWNATFSQTGAAVTLTHASWNRIIPPGGSVTVGLYGARSAPPTPPPTIFVNGVPCAA